MSGMIIASFLLFMALFAGVGMASIFVKKDTTDDYLVAGRGMHPALAALSAVSTWNSGYMFIGFIGFTYSTGYNVLWLGLVSTFGQVLAWAWLYKFIQKEGQERGIRSLSSLVSGKAGAPEAKMAAILSVLFLSIYAAAQLTSGGKALLVMMGWPEMTGILIGFVLVVAYCYAGGIRASIWTDAVQSCVMIVGSIILCVIALNEVGGFSGLNSGLEAQSSALTSIWPQDLRFGFSMWAFAFFLGGLGVAGQPQVVSRVMTLGSDKDRKQAMIWFFVWQTPFIIIMLIIGLVSRVLFNSISDFDPELGLPKLAMETMPALGVGMILASIFAATMSTADSQVLACTAAITDDIKPEWREDHKTTKKVTIVVAIFATLISIAGLYVPGGDSVFELVVLAVYGLGAIFIPLLTIRWMGYEPDSTHSLVMMASAFFGVIIWTLLDFGGADGIFPSVPGMGAAFLAHILMCNFRDDSDSKFLANLEIPKPIFNQGIAAIIVIVLLSEVAYLVVSPDTNNSDEVPANYLVKINEDLILFDSGSEYVGDGTTLQIPINTDSIQSWPNGTNVVGIRVLLTFGEDETSSGLGCALDGEPATDIVSATVSHSLSDYPDWNSSGTNFDGNGGASFVSLPSVGGGDMPSFIFGDLGFYAWSLANTNLSIGDYSKSEIENVIDLGDSGLGDYFLEINVDAQEGGSFQCQHTDEGEQIDYEVTLITWDYEIMMCEGCLVGFSKGYN